MGCCQQFISRLSNFLLLLLGVASLVLGIYALVFFYRDGKNSPTINIHDVKDWNDAQTALNKIDSQEAWIYYLTVVLGFFMVLTATIGICCASPQSVCCLGCYYFMACTITLAQIALVIAILIKDVKVIIPEGVSQEITCVYKFLNVNLVYLEIGILAVELVMIFSGCCCSCSECCDKGGYSGEREPLISKRSPKFSLNNHANQCNPNNWRYQGYHRQYSGIGTKADLNNHANQMNPNNWRYTVV